MKFTSSGPCLVPIVPLLLAALLSPPGVAQVPAPKTAPVVQQLAPPPAPVLNIGLVEGSSRITGNISKPATGGVTVKVFVNRAEVALSKLLISVDGSSFEAELPVPLAAGDVVSALEAFGSVEGPRSTGIRIKGVPSIRGSFTEGDKEIKGSAAPGASGVEVVVRDSTGVQSQQAAGALGTGNTFTVTLKNELAAGDLVRVRETGGGEFSDPVKVAAKPDPGPSAPQISSVDATYGGSKVTVYFAKLGSTIDGGTVTVQTCLEQAVHTLSADELKAVKVDVPLARGLFCEPDKWLPLVKFDVTAKKVQKSACLQEKPAGSCVDTPAAKVAIPNVTLSEVLKEGDFEVKGKASGGVTKVRVEVHGGWASDPRIDETPKQHCPAPNDQASPKFFKSRVQFQEDKVREYEACNTPAPKGLRNALRCEQSELLQSQEDIQVDAKSGAFSTKLDSRLNAGDCVVAIPEFDAVPEAANQYNSALFSNGVIARSILLDWGRLRGYFSLGGSVSQYRKQFSQVDSFVGFTADARIWGHNLIQKCQDPKAKPGTPQCNAMRSFALGGPIRAQLNLFTDARIAFQLANSGTTATAASTTSQTAVPATPAVPLNQINLATTQPGYFQVALHLPISTAGTDWIHKGHQYSFFAGPIVKLGGQTQDSDLLLSRTLNITDGKKPTDSDYYSLVKETKRSGLLPFYGYGVRLGMFSYDLLGDLTKSVDLRERQVANDPIGYLDFTWGTNHAYRSYQFTSLYQCKDGSGNLLNCTATQTPPVNPTGLSIDSQLNPQFTIEGRLKIPYLPALIGIDYGVRTRANDQDPNVFRFILAFRVDAQKALGKIFGSDFRDK